MLTKRGPNKFQNPLTLQDMYKAYIKDFDVDHPYHIPYSEYKDIISEYLKYISEEVVVKSMQYKLPFRLGTLCVYKHKPFFKSTNKMSVDWKETKKQGKKIYLFNNHSNGYRYRFLWDRNGSNAKFLKMYAFKASRSNSRTIASLVKERKNDYFEK